MNYSLFTIPSYFTLSSPACLISFKQYLTLYSYFYGPNNSVKTFTVSAHVNSHGLLEIHDSRTPCGQRYPAYEETAFLLHHLASLLIPCGFVYLCVFKGITSEAHDFLNTIKQIIFA